MNVPIPPPIFDNNQVAVIIPTFNSEKTIRRALDSVFLQTYPLWHITIVDDFSTDKTVEVVQGYICQSPVKIRIFTNDRNRGPAHARNVGIAHSRGNWIAPLDADDAWDPCRLEVLLVKAIEHSADAVCDNLLAFDSNTFSCGRPLFSNLPPLLNFEDAVSATYQGSYNLGYLKPVFQRSFIKAKGINYSDLRTGEDLILTLTMLAAGAKIICVDVPTYFYTTQTQSSTGRFSESSATHPRDLELAAALQELAEKFGDRINTSVATSIQSRVDYLKSIHALSAFRYSILRRNWRKAVFALVNHRTVRQYACRSIARRLFGNR